ncbi:tRNA pseudouridine(55) synthase TruB [Marinihelvus fidelis]|uniref:tRNA pseudouridine synthase B n=1 Tax=Marinihelvus fidelis TaxID=2613842 RepID=A0A5N0T628_9GAMM|nr:tRNA pseudouridine(55) synthase TruB [Marinihelvus fidelis]KAA9130271.1 tRNA pseudouridine(55) synthase TruB [Marinihelvus fidelis]
MSRRRRGEAIDGVVLLDKPAGLSSNQALQRVRRAFNARKAGHTGTLDPFATGMLPLCLGEATKTSAFILDAGKAYRATARLGIATSTGDPEGEVLLEQDVPPVDEARLRDVLDSFVGLGEQVPPMYSAIKHQGRPLYEYARRGIEIERQPRPVEIHAIELLSIDGPDIRFEVTCGKGTYIRTLAEDIARAFGTVAHLVALRRQWVHPFGSQSMVTLEQVEQASENGELDSLRLPADAGLADWPVVTLGAEALQRLAHGNPVDSNGSEKGLVRLHDSEGTARGIGECLDGQIRPRRVFVRDDP